MIQLDSQSPEFATVRDAVLLTATVNIIKVRESLLEKILIVFFSIIFRSY